MNCCSWHITSRAVVKDSEYNMILILRLGTTNNIDFELIFWLVIFWPASFSAKRWLFWYFKDLIKFKYVLHVILYLKFLFKILKSLFTDQFMILNFRWDSYEDFESNLKLLKSIPNMVKQIQNLLELGITNEITFAKGY